MPSYRQSLPQLSDRIFLTDGGLETTLIFHEGVDLPLFAGFTELRTPEGTARLRRYYARYAAMAVEAGAGFILESVTWRASRDWADRLGLAPPELAELNRRSIALLQDVRAEYETPASPMVISGAIGPRGDGYQPGRRMSANEARDYHAEQIETFACTQADMVAAFTINYVEEAVGLTRAAAACRMPLAVSFTVETDGSLPTGQPLREAVEQVDAETGSAPAYYMINCAHPTHFAHVLPEGEAWTQRLRGIRANASTRSHAELDEATALDAGDPADFGRRYRDLRRTHPRLTVLGGCCGTDERHVRAIRLACLPATPQARVA